MTKQEAITIDTSEEATISAVDTRVVMGSASCNDKDWVNLKRRARRNGYSLPKQVLVDAIKRRIKKEGILRKNYDAVLVVELPCGSASYKTWDDIPNESVPCPCGNPKHWLIRYRT